MIDKLCNFISNKIKQKVDGIDEERALIIDFGVNIIFGEMPKIALLFIIGFILQIGWYTLILFFLLAPYRSFTGGFHLKTHWGCMITTIILYIFPTLLAKYMMISQNNILYLAAVIIGIFSLVVITKYAPADTENIPILSKKERKSKKIKSYISLIVLLTISVLIPDKIISYMLLYGIFLENLTVLPIAYKVTNNKYGYEVYS